MSNCASAAVIIVRSRIQYTGTVERYHIAFYSYRTIVYEYSSTGMWVAEDDTAEDRSTGEGQENKGTSSFIPVPVPVPVPVRYAVCVGE